jgi:hypothetical protein
VSFEEDLELEFKSSFSTDILTAFTALLFSIKSPKPERERERDLCDFIFFPFYKCPELKSEITVLS